MEELTTTLSSLSMEDEVHKIKNDLKNVLDYFVINGSISNFKKNNNKKIINFIQYHGYKILQDIKYQYYPTIYIDDIDLLCILDYYICSIQNSS